MIDDRQEEFLLLKVLPEQVSRYWDRFAPLIAKSLPPMITDRRQRMANVLRSVLMEELEVWVYYDKQMNVRYVVSTIVREDKVSLSRDLLIYSFTSMGQVMPSHLKNGFERLKEYAKDINCQGIIAYVDDEGIKKFLKHNGADVSFSLVQIEV